MFRMMAAVLEQLGPVLWFVWFVLRAIAVLVVLALVEMAVDDEGPSWGSFRRAVERAFWVVVEWLFNHWRRGYAH